MEELSPGRCQVRLPFSDRVSQQHGFFHGGVIATVADTAGGYAAMSLCETGTEVLTAEFKINFVSPARGTDLLATGTVIRSGRTLIVTRADVEVIANGVRMVCATLLQTIAVREKAPSL